MSGPERSDERSLLLDVVRGAQAVLACVFGWSVATADAGASRSIGGLVVEPGVGGAVLVFFALSTLRRRRFGRPAIQEINVFGALLAVFFVAGSLLT